MTTGKPFRLGLTGSIGMGKSTTAEMFRDAGVPVWDADAAVHRFYAPAGAAVEALRALAPEVIEDGGVSRSRLHALIAADRGALARVEAIVHPLVARDRAVFIAAARAAAEPLVVLDIPLLFETGAERQVDAVAVVSAPAALQRARVLERTGMTEARFEFLLSRQIPDHEKRARADYIIETNTLECARAAVRRVLERLKRGQTHA